MTTFTAPTILELLHKVYKYHGWTRQRGESRTKRVKTLYNVTMDTRNLKFIAAPKEVEANQ